MADLTVRSNAEAIPGQPHPDKEFRVNRGTPRMNVEVDEMRPDTGQINEAVNGPSR